MKKTPPKQQLHTLKVPVSLADSRLGDALKSLMPELSSRMRVMVVANGLVQVGGAMVTNLDHPVSEGDEVVIDLRHGTHGEGKSKRPPLLEQMRVLHDDDDVVVVSKAAGIVVQPVQGEKIGTPLIELLKHYWRAQKKHLVNPILIQRLDKMTSGVMVLAKTVPAGRHLQRQAGGRFMERTYIALVDGLLADDKGTWRSYLGEGEGQLRQAVAPCPLPEGEHPPTGAQEAITHYRVLERFPGATLIELKLETGRTHQIRIHCAEAGHPVVGDRVYIKLASMRFPMHEFCVGLPGPRRMMLHAARLKFQHPTTESRWLTFRDELPESFVSFLDILRGGADPEPIVPVKGHKKGKSTRRKRL